MEASFSWTLDFLFAVLKFKARVLLHWATLPAPDFFLKAFKNSFLEGLLLGSPPASWTGWSERHVGCSLAAGGWESTADPVMWELLCRAGPPQFVICPSFTLPCRTPSPKRVVCAGAGARPWLPFERYQHLGVSWAQEDILRIPYFCLSLRLEVSCAWVIPTLLYVSFFIFQMSGTKFKRKPSRNG